MKATKDDSDASLARQALVEGDGMALMIEYRLAGEGYGAPWDHDEVVRLLTANMNVDQGGTQLIDRAPVALREAMLFPYRAGVAFVAALRKGRPWTAVDGAFTRPPRSTEQVLHPALYFADARPDAITPTADPTTIDSAVWGEEGWREFLLAHGVDADRAAQAMAGWGGDRVVVRGAPAAVAAPWRAVGSAVLTWDTDVDALEFWDAASHALDHLAAGTLIVDAPDRMVWLSWQGRVTAMARRDRAIAIVTGAPAHPLVGGAGRRVALVDHVGRAALAEPAPAPRPRGGRRRHRLRRARGGGRAGPGAAARPRRGGLRPRRARARRRRRRGAAAAPVDRDGGGDGRRARWSATASWRCGCRSRSSGSPTSRWSAPSRVGTSARRPRRWRSRCR
jgi:hypothetical protein